MKIGIFISTIKAISAWLHGEGGKHFRTYTWPRIKSFTRKYIDLGIYEKIEGAYKVIDDTFYNGVIPEEAQNPIVVARLEHLAEEIEGEGLTDTFAATSLPQFKDIRDKLFIWKGLEQGNTYKCGTYTMNNMLRTAMLQMGLQPPLEVTAIDPLYIETKAGPGKEGTVMDHAFEWLHKNGFPIPSWTPLMQDHNKELSALEKSDTIRNAKKFASIRATGNRKTVYSFDEAKKLDAELPSNWLMQVSINFCASLDYFGELVPYVKQVNGKYSFIRTGGHSVHGVRGSFSTWEDGDAGFAIIDSAYRSREDGWRFLKSNLFLYGLLSVRFVELELSGAAPVQPTPTPVPTPDNDKQLLATLDIEYAERGEKVKALQRYLMASGYAIPAGPTDYFGDQTKAALKAWQDKQFGPLYTGEFWGPISRQRFVELNALG